MFEDRTRATCLKEKYLPLRYLRNTLATSLALKVHILVWSLNVRRCHVSQIQKRFTRNRSVERHFIIGHCRLIYSHKNDLKNVRCVFLTNCTQYLTGYVPHARRNSCTPVSSHRATVTVVRCYPNLEYVGKCQQTSPIWNVMKIQLAILALQTEKQIWRI
jgi:hypothetical protein